MKFAPRSARCTARLHPHIHVLDHESCHAYLGACLAALLRCYRVTAGRGSNLPCRDRVTAAPGSNLPHRARLLPRPAVTVTWVPAGPGLLPGAAVTCPEARGYCRSNPGTSRTHSESARKRGAAGAPLHAHPRLEGCPIQRKRSLRTMRPLIPAALPTMRRLPLPPSTSKSSDAPGLWC